MIAFGQPGRNPRVHDISHSLAMPAVPPWQKRLQSRLSSFWLHAAPKDRERGCRERTPAPRLSLQDRVAIVGMSPIGPTFAVCAPGFSVGYQYGTSSHIYVFSDGTTPGYISIGRTPGGTSLVGARADVEVSQVRIRDMEKSEIPQRRINKAQSKAQGKGYRTSTHQDMSAHRRRERI